jgi:hypothetical protein
LKMKDRTDKEQDVGLFSRERTNAGIDGGDYRDAQSELLNLAKNYSVIHGEGTSETRARHSVYPLVDAHGPWNSYLQGKDDYSFGNKAPAECLYALLNLHNRLVPGRWKVGVGKTPSSWTNQFSEYFTPASDQTKDRQTPTSTTPKLFGRYTELLTLAGKVLQEKYVDIPKLAEQKKQREDLLSQAGTGRSSDVDLATLTSEIASRSKGMWEAESVLRDSIVSFNEALSQAETLARSTSALAKLETGKLTVSEAPNFNLEEAKTEAHLDRVWAQTLSKNPEDLAALIDGDRPISINPRSRNTRGEERALPER